MLACVGCNCGNTDNLIRNSLRRYGYSDYLNIPIPKGREKALNLISGLPPFPELEELRQHLKNRGRFAIIIGYNDTMCRWSDITVKNPTASLDAELIVQHFG